MRKFVIAALCALLCLSACQSTDETLMRTISVSGSGSVTIDPDMATFSVSVEEIAGTTAEAQAKANEKMAEVYRILSEEYGIPADDLRTTGINLYPRYSYSDGQQILTGQCSQQDIRVKVRDLDELAPIIDSLSSVTNITISSINLDAEDKEDVMSEARILAMQNAYRQAEDYASAAGLTVDGPVSISSGSVSWASNRIQPVALATSADHAESSKASLSYYAGDLEVNASVSVTFNLI